MGLGRQLRVAGSAPVADHAPDDQGLDQEEDRRRDHEDDRVEIVDLAALGRDRFRREEAPDDLGSVADQQEDEPDEGENGDESGKDGSE